MLKFNVTYEIVTPESAEHGDAEERGFIAESVDLRSAIELVYETRTNHVDGITAVEADQCPVVSPTWISVYNGLEYLTGAQETRSIHFPENMTNASRMRIARLMDCYGC